MDVEWETDSHRCLGYRRRRWRHYRRRRRRYRWRRATCGRRRRSRYHCWRRRWASRRCWHQTTRHRSTYNRRCCRWGLVASWCQPARRRRRRRRRGRLAWPASAEVERMAPEPVASPPWRGGRDRGVLLWSAGVRSCLQFCQHRRRVRVALCQPNGGAAGGDECCGGDIRGVPLHIKAWKKISSIGPTCQIQENRVEHIKHSLGVFSNIFKHVCIFLLTKSDKNMIF